MENDTQSTDPDALYRMHVHQVGRWVVRLGGPSMDVEDTVHEVFAVACAKLPGFRGESSLATWLFGITDKVVRRRRHKQRWWHWLSGSADETAGALPAPHGNPLQDFEKAETAHSVYRVLDRLSEGDRRILILFELEELSADEVGALLGIKAANARLRLHRARARFFKIYQREFSVAETNLTGCEHVSE